MKRNSILEQRRKHISKEVYDSVSLSFKIVDRIHAILEEKGMTQKDLAHSLGKSEAEISKWMRGLHNFTLDTICKIETALGAKIVEVAKDDSAKPHICVLFSDTSKYTSYGIKNKGLIIQQSDNVNAIYNDN